MDRRRLLMILTLCGVAALLAVVAWQVPHTSATSESRRRFYDLNVVNSAIPAWRAADETLQKMAAVTPGLRTEFSGPTDGDASKQIAQLDALLQRGVNGIILCPADMRTLAPTINRAADRGIPVVTIFGDVEGSARLTAVTAAEETSAYALATKVIAQNRWDEAVEGTVPVMIVMTKPGLPFAEQRLAGLRRALREHKALKLVSVVSNDWSERRGAEEVSAALQTFPSLAAVFGTDSRAGVGAVTALKETSHAKGSVVVTGWDSDEDTLRLIAEGWIIVSSAPNITTMTQVAVAILEAYNRDYLYPPSMRLREFHVSPLPSHIDIMQNLIDRSNVEAFLPATAP